MSTIAKCEHLLEMLTESQPSLSLRDEMDSHLEECENCRELVRRIGPAINWINALENGETSLKSEVVRVSS